jgi:hypothetical protein
MLVYDFRTKAWAGMDCGPSICPLEFFQCTYNGVQRLAFVGADGFVSMVEAMAGHDQAGAPDTRYGLSLTPIATSLTSRGYAIGSENIKRWQRVRVVLATAGACYSITLNTGSAASNAIVRKDVRQDRAKVLRPFDAPRFVRSNIKQDFMKQGRADYSVVFPLGGMVLMPGINLSLFQEFTQRISARPKAGRYLQVTLTNSEGRMKIKSITPDAVEGARREGTIN